MEKLNKFIFQEEDKDYYVTLLRKEHDKLLRTYLTQQYTSTNIEEIKKIHKLLVDCGDYYAISSVKNCIRSAVEAEIKFDDGYLIVSISGMIFLLRKLDSGNETAEFSSRAEKLLYGRERKFLKNVLDIAMFLL